MHLQGNLQIVFDALFEMGIIDPLLKKDWSKITQEKFSYDDEIEQAVRIVNSYKSVEDLMEALMHFDERTLEFLAMEVAREYADYTSRTSLH